MSNLWRDEDYYEVGVYFPELPPGLRGVLGDVPAGEEMTNR